MSKLSSLIDKIKHWAKDPLRLSRWVDDYRPADSNRVTVWVNDGYSRRKIRDDGSELFMFRQDIENRIMPFRNSDDGMTVELRCGCPELEKLIGSALSMRDYSYGLEDSLSEFVRSVTQSVIHYNDAYFEVYCEKDEEGKITKLDLNYIYPPSIRKAFGRYFQIITFKAAKHAHVKAGIKAIPKNRILHIVSPRALGGRKGMRKLSEGLYQIGKTIYPNFQLKAMEMNEDSGFRFDKYVRQKYIDVARLTKRFGWDQRKYDDNNVLEYYRLHRKLKSERAKTIFRDHVVTELNKALNNKYVNAEVRLIVSGIKTTKIVDTQIEALKKGNLAFGPLWDSSIKED